MKAWVVARPARPTQALELRETMVPNPGPGQVRVRVGASACNFNEVDGCYDGGHAAQVLCDVLMVFDAPASLDDAQAAALFFPYHVACSGSEGVRAG